MLGNDHQMTGYCKQTHQHFSAGQKKSNINTVLHHSSQQIQHNKLKMKSFKLRLAYKDYLSLQRDIYCQNKHKQVKKDEEQR
jgi:DNA topoisomerase VI subunit A